MFKRKPKAPAPESAPAVAAKKGGPDLAAEAKQRAQADEKRKAAVKKAQDDEQQRKRDMEEKKRAQEAAEKKAQEAAARDAEAKLAAAQEAAAKEAAAKAERDAQNDKWRMQLAKMQSTDLLGASLEKELASELSAVRQKLETGKSAVTSLETEVKEVEEASVAGREKKAGEISTWQEQLSSLDAVRSVVAAYEGGASVLVALAKDAHDELDQQAADASGVATRMTRELDEAHARLSVCHLARAPPTMPALAYATALALAYATALGPESRSCALVLVYAHARTPATSASAHRASLSRATVDRAPSRTR